MEKVEIEQKKQRLKVVVRRKQEQQLPCDERRKKCVNKYQVHAQTHTYQSIANSIHAILNYHQQFYVPSSLVNISDSHQFTVHDFCSWDDSLVYSHINND